jgi:putative component of membrane protein insertase Oxa1/YidC/SpoIIIJ protein YidD
MKAIVIAIFLFLPFKGLCQSQEDLKKFETLFLEKKHTHVWRGQLKDNKNEFTFVFSALFVLYKEAFSSQDIDACVFTPSCSVYAIESIKRNGLILGACSAADRLTRCNPGRKKNVPFNPETGRYSDPVN